MNSKKRILIAPLNWGLGHATRCIPIIKMLQQMGQEVIIGANGAAGELLKSEFQDLQFIEIPGYDFQYGSGKNQLIPILKQLPAFWFSIKNEHKHLKKIIKLYDIDAVISDNRYGLWSKEIPSVLISHQIFIKAPEYFSLLEPLLHKIHFHLLNNFDYCWIPDLPDKDLNLSGNLSHKESLSPKFKFIGLLSRFSSHIKKGKDSLVVAIVSGLEPQRTIFQKMLEKQLTELGKKSVIVSGNKNEEYLKLKEVEIFPLRNSIQLEDIFVNSSVVISRSGYSSLMDYIALGLEPIVVPTPGQTEQEYLAEYLKMNKWCYSMSQDNLNIKKGIEEKSGYKFPEAFRKENNLLEEAIFNLINLQ